MTVSTFARGNLGTATRKLLSLVHTVRTGTPVLAGPEGACLVAQPYQLSGTAQPQDEFEEPEQFGGLLTF